MIPCAALAAATTLAVALPTAGQVAAGAPRAKAPSQVAVRVERWRPWITEASARFGVPSPWIVAVIRAESAGRVRIDGRPIVSRAGAMGLMQLMPGTWLAMRRQFGLGGDPYDPRANILAGTSYLRAMYDRFGYPGLFSAYNAGPERYADYLARRRSLPAETRAYAAAIAGAPVPVAAQPARLAVSLFVGAGAFPGRPASFFVSGPSPRSLFYVLSSKK